MKKCPKCKVGELIFKFYHEYGGTIFKKYECSNCEKTLTFIRNKKGAIKKRKGAVKVIKKRSSYDSKLFVETECLKCKKQMTMTKYAKFTEYRCPKCNKTIKTDHKKE